MKLVEHFVTSSSPEAVWKILADLERWPEWLPTILKIEPLSTEGLVVGARYRISQPKLRPAVYVVTQLIPERSFTWTQRIAGGRLIAGHRLQPCDGGCEVEHSFASEGFLANVLASLFSKMIREYVATEARSLENCCKGLE